MKCPKAGLLPFGPPDRGVVLENPLFAAVGREYRFLVGVEGEILIFVRRVRSYVARFTGSERTSCAI